MCLCFRLVAFEILGQEPTSQRAVQRARIDHRSDSLKATYLIVVPFYYSYTSAQLFVRRHVNDFWKGESKRECVPLGSKR